MVAQAQQHCLMGALGRLLRVGATPVTFAFNPYRTIEGGHAVLDQSVTDEVMAACADSRSDGGPQCVLGNNALADTSTAGRSAAVYTQIDSRGGQSWPVPVSFQTVGGRGLSGDRHRHRAPRNFRRIMASRPGLRGFAAVPTTDLEA